MNTGRGRRPARVPSLLALLVLLAMAGGCGDDEEATVERSPVLGGTVSVAIPGGWEVEHDSNQLLVAGGPGEPAQLLTATWIPDDGDLDELIAEHFGDEATVASTTVSGADEARTIERETPGGLWQRGVLAHHPDGPVVAVLLGADVDDPPSPDLVDGVLGSVELAADAIDPPATD